jgi:uncharacterized SAM-binding protein YcdF (DUF218 family)
MRDALLHLLLSLIEPIGFIWLCLLVLTATLWWKRQRRFALATGFLAVFVTVIGSTSLPGRILLGSLERPYAGIQLDALPAADAIVLLGGGAAASRYEANGVHVTPSGDRIVMAHALFRMGKAPVMLLGGSESKLDGVVHFESEIVRELLVTWGVPKEAMIPLASNADTHDEALKVRALAAEHGWRRFLLVTSANHLRRASATFRAQGLEVIPVPCNFLTTISTAPAPRPPGFAVPGNDGFVKMATWMHEEIGYFIYRRRGWITE